MQKQSFWMFVGFSALVGCSSTTFTTAETSDAGKDQINESTTSNDGGIDSPNDTPVTCEPYSCRSGCGECDAGMQCGNGGAFTCGSRNCAAFSLDVFTDAATYNCPSEMTLIYRCAHYSGQNNKDIMPRCLSRGGSTADGEYTYWCCPQ